MYKGESGGGKDLGKDYIEMTEESIFFIGIYAGKNWKNPDYNRVRDNYHEIG